MNSHSDGCGDGHGDGYGHGYGYGDGEGYGEQVSGNNSCEGYGYKLGSAGDYDVFTLWPWRYVKVGCECHRVEWWRQNWRTVAQRNKVSILPSEVEEMLCKASLCAAELRDERSCLGSANRSQ